jgi:nitric oxide reductase large subunit
MNLPLLIYLTDIANSTKNITELMLFISVVIFGVTMAAWCMTCDSYQEKEHASIDKFLKWLINKSWIAGIILIISIAIPSKTTMYLMLGTSYLADSKIPSQVSEILDLKLKDVLKQLKKETRDE